MNLIAIAQVQDISTPEYPHQYRSNLTCTWTITATSNYLVQLETGFVSNDTCCENLQVNLKHDKLAFFDDKFFL